MKTYIAPEVEICMFDVENIITTSAADTLKVLGITVDEVSYADLEEDLSGIDILK